MGCTTEQSTAEPTAPEVPQCESCGATASLQCGVCTELFFCERPECYNAVHPRARDRETHHASVSSYGTSSNCAQHPEYKLHLVCEENGCNDALICMRCANLAHSGHNTTDISQYTERQRYVLRSHMADLTKQRHAATEEALALKSLPPPDVRYKELILKTHLGYLLMEEGVSRSHIECEEDVEWRCLTQALSTQGEVCALETFATKVAETIAECDAVCHLGDDQALRVVTDSQAILRKIDALSNNADRHRLASASHPHTELTLSLPMNKLTEALSSRRLTSNTEHLFKIFQFVSPFELNLVPNGNEVERWGERVDLATTITEHCLQKHQSTWRIAIQKNAQQGVIMLGIVFKDCALQRMATEGGGIGAFNGYGVSNAGYIYAGSERAQRPCERLRFAEGDTVCITADRAKKELRFTSRGVTIVVPVPNLQTEDFYPAVTLSAEVQKVFIL